MTNVQDAAHLGAAVWPEAGPVTVFAPVGSLEQHGPHLPLDTDTRIASAVAERLAGAVRADGSDAVVSPPIAYGASGEHQDFPGTISIGTQALAGVLLEFGRSACLWAGRVVFVNGHGGNVDALVEAVPRLRLEGRDAAWLACTVDPADAPPDFAGDAHAGRTETSLLEHLTPGAIRRDRIEAGVTESLGSVLPRLRAEGVRAVAPNGVLGDPHGATAGEGKVLFEAICAGALRRLDVGRVAANGRLDG